MGGCLSIKQSATARLGEQNKHQDLDNADSGQSASGTKPHKSTPALANDNLSVNYNDSRDNGEGSALTTVCSAGLTNSRYLLCSAYETWVGARRSCSVLPVDI